MITLPQEFQAARLRLVKDRPYLASAAWSLQPVEKPGLGTMAVDMFWRLYYDPSVCQRWTVEELSGVLYHEIMHLLRDHAGRMRDLDPRASNICADAEINDDLIREGVRLPADPVTPTSIGQPDNLLAEEYYAALSQARQSASSQGASAQSQDGGQSQAGDDRQGDGQGQNNAETAPENGASSANHGGDDGNQSNPSPTAQGGSQADSDQPGDQGDSSGSKAGDSSGSKPGDGGKGETVGSSQGPPSSGCPSDSSTQPGDSSQPPAGPGESRGDGHDGSQSGDRTQTPAPGSGRCGSCATGRPESWEDGPPGEGTSSGTSRAEGELIRRDVARQIQEHSKARSNVPGHWKRWADEKLRPRVDWRKELASAVRHAVADMAGASDYSYRRPSRRQGQVGNGKVVLPSMRRPVPSVAVVVDTSGSVDDTMLNQALAEISGILKGLGQRDGIHVLAVDTQVQACRRVFRPEQVHLAGGGGTDMGAGLEAAAKLRPVPQVAVVITDGWTDWPDQSPHGMKVVVALSGDGKSPEWAKTVKLERGE